MSLSDADADPILPAVEVPAEVPARMPKLRIAALLIAGVAALLALAGAAAVTRPSTGDLGEAPSHAVAAPETEETSAAAPPWQPTQLWGMSCFPQMCDCSWATPGPMGTCSRRAYDGTECWDCCCRDMYREPKCNFFCPRHKLQKHHKKKVHKMKVRAWRFEREYPLLYWGLMCLLWVCIVSLLVGAIAAIWKAIRGKDAKTPEAVRDLEQTVGVEPRRNRNCWE